MSITSAYRAPCDGQSQDFRFLALFDAPRPHRGHAGATTHLHVGAHWRKERRVSDWERRHPAGRRREAPPLLLAATTLLFAMPAPSTTHPALPGSARVPRAAFGVPLNAPAVPARPTRPAPAAPTAPPAQPAPPPAARPSRASPH
ncbi:MAG: hypothetical protein LBI02_02815, partial [Opitutaceae bacterium]|nr:hypothetical protein [Opitutaceae bacterium]